MLTRILCRTFVAAAFCAVGAVLLPLSSGHAQEGGAAAIGIQPSAVSDEMDDASLTQKASLILGYNTIAKMAFELKRQGIELDMAKVIEGAQLAADQKDLGMAKEDVQKVMMALQNRAREGAMAKMKIDAENNKAAGEAFLAQNEQKEGVKKLDNGVQYEILKEGDGKTPEASDSVTLHYHGTNVAGEVFDSSVDRGEPITHSASGFVEGFNSAVQAMPVGSKWRVAIPSDLAYGMQGPLGPNQTLIFEIELLKIAE